MNTRTNVAHRRFSLILVLALLSTLNHQLSTCLAQGTAFTYQGRLVDGASAANGSYDLGFTPYDNPNAGSIVAAPVTNSRTGVTNSLFLVTLDFGASAFMGLNRWLQIDVRTNGAGTFIPLVPRQQITPAPYAIYSPGAAAATTALSANSAPQAQSIMLPCKIHRWIPPKLPTAASQETT